MEEKEDLGGIRVAFGKGEKVEVVVSYVEILYESVRSQVSKKKASRLGNPGRNPMGDRGMSVRLCLRLRNMVVQLRILLRLLRVGREIFRRRT